MSRTILSENQAELWFYEIRGEAFRHGMVTQAILVRMATQGLLQAHDLVWLRAGENRWRLAGSVPGLCPAPPKPDTPDTTSKENLRARRHRVTIPLLLTLGVGLIMATLWFARKLRLHELDPSPYWMHRLLGVDNPYRKQPGFHLQSHLIELYLNSENFSAADTRIGELARIEGGAELADQYRQQATRMRQMAVERESLRQIHAETTRHLDEGRTDAAAMLIPRLAQSDEWRATAEKLNRRLQAMRHQAECKRSFVALLRSGQIHAGNAMDETLVFRENQIQHELYAQLESALRDRTLPPRVCLSIAHVYLALNRHSLVGEALDRYAERTRPGASEEETLNATLLFSAIGRQAASIATLQRHLEAEPEHVHARLELAAILAETDDRKGALSHLRLAVRKGGNPIRQKALDDPRFDAVRDTWTFGRLTRMD
jgi:hypothetical protein